MEYLLDEAPVAIKTTGEPSVAFATGFCRGYREGIEDLAGDIGEASLRIGIAFRKRYQSTKTRAFRTRALKAYRTML